MAITTDLTVSGRVAQFGRGVMADVTAKLLQQFVGNLEANVPHPTGREKPPARAMPGATALVPPRMPRARAVQAPTAGAAVPRGAGPCRGHAAAGPPPRLST